MGFIGIALTIYIYFATREVPEIRYYVNPVRAVIAKAGVNSALSVLYNNQPVPDDVPARHMLADYRQPGDARRRLHAVELARSLRAARSRRLFARCHGDA